MSQEAGEVSGPPRHDEKGNDRYEKITHHFDMLTLKLSNALRCRVR